MSEAGSDVLNSILLRTAPRNIQLVVARGLFPLAPREQLAALVCLAEAPDPAVAGQAGLTLSAWPAEEVLVQLRDRSCSPALLAYFARSQDRAVVEAVIANPGTPDAVIEELSARAPSELLDRLLENRARILRHPEMLAAMRSNPALSPEAARIIGEIEAEFFGSKTNVYAVPTPAPQQEDAPGPEPEAAEAAGVDLTLEGLPEDPDARQAALLERISRMSVRAKIQLALAGPKEARMILVRDANREVARNVLHSPKVTDSEIETFAAMRNVSEDVLREIGSRREWVRSYTVVHNLVKNPKTPPLVSQRLISRILSKDLSALARDRSVPEAVRRNAQRALNQRSPARRTS